ncbi:relaxase/mobilization nuclease domain-containing protein [Rhodobium gokarnense]|uniref:MobA/VirD2-like nuclease domain-containing protein n=1 Tax=Rhodobium gokarnense TaxID=364296 RepID=A0ABT3HF11_9HYPH|nr:relaxase/mobilization nuclease domain-containing protein [Rhodobium gokarnense]MCW2308960.1 hypothetical protein [Rhodobium gokarnense]
MILVGSQRGGAKQLAVHLMNDRDNDHVTVQELRGFSARNLPGAFIEVEAISSATQCRQPLFSLSLNPPKGADVPVKDLMAAIDRAEERLGLSGQPRAVVIHEKEGRRHAHAVWSRIDGAKMTAINLPYFKTRLKGLSKELYLDHGWDLPEGHRTNGWKNPLNFTLAEWQQAKRLDLDPREIKQVFRDAWAHSDNKKSFGAALEQSGFYLAKGDRRGFVALDLYGNAYSVSRWAGFKAREVRDRLGDPSGLPSVADVRAATRRRLGHTVRSYMQEMRDEQRHDAKPLADERKAMVAAQRTERRNLDQGQDTRRKAEARAAPPGCIVACAGRGSFSPAKRGRSAGRTRRTPTGPSCATATSASAFTGRR